MFRRILAVSSLVVLAPACGSGGDQAARDGLDGTSCALQQDEADTTTLACPDGTSVSFIEAEEGHPGARGESGAEGAPGRQGDPGHDGEAGRDGEPGDEGHPGEDGDPGQEGRPGRQGDAGQKGQPGEAGDAGNPGKTCSVECDDQHTVRIYCEDGSEVTYPVRLCGDALPAWLSVGDEHACQVRPTDGRLVCWGSDAYQKLGNGAFVADQVGASFVDTRTLPDAMQTTWELVSVSKFATCGLTPAGDAYCWGNVGIAENGGVTWLPSAVDMSGLSSGTVWSTLTSGINGSTICGITSDGDGYCWGDDGNGERGDGAMASAPFSPSPIDTSALPAGTSWSVLSAGRSHTCGLTVDGTAYCWGSDASGQLGNGRLVTANQATPAAVDVSFLPPETSWSTISAGDDHTCAVSTLGKAYCWGSDAKGQLGRNGVVAPSDYPQLVDDSELVPGTSWSRISAGGEHSCGVATDGAAYCWGNASSGRLGDGRSAGTRPHPVPVQIDALPGATQWAEVDAGGAFSCGLTSQGAVYCWGSDEHGELGNGARSGHQTKPEHSVAVTFGIFPDPVVHPNLLRHGVQNVNEIAGAVGDPTNPSLLMTLLPMETPLEDLTISASSSNESVLPTSNISFWGSGVERTVSLDPVARGSATVTFTVKNGKGEEITFVVDYAVSAQIPDASGRYHSHISDASAAVDVGDGYMLLANDESNRLYLHKQDESGPPLKVWDFMDDGTQLRTTEADIEGGARVGNQVVWITSHGNGRDGDAKEYRRVLFATTITGSGADVELTFLGRYGGGPGGKDDVAVRGLWPDLINWDRTNGHGLGTDHLDFFAATQDGVLPNAPDGFNIEGFEFAADGTTGYLGFRAPTIAVNGTEHALIVPVTNLLELVNGTGVQSGRAAFGSPILLNLGGRSIRALRRSASSQFLISAGPPDGATPGVNDSWGLYTWDGDPNHPPVYNQQLPAPEQLTTGSWESILSVPEPLQPGAPFRLVADSGDTDFYGTGETKDLTPGFQKSYSQLFTLR